MNGLLASCDWGSLCQFKAKDHAYLLLVCLCLTGVLHTPNGTVLVGLKITVDVCVEQVLQDEIDLAAIIDVKEEEDGNH